MEQFLADSRKEYIYDDRTTLAFTVVATEIGFAKVNRDPQRAIELADIAISQFNRLQRLRNGSVDTNMVAPYYVKALALLRLSDRDAAVAVCREGLAITDHGGLRNILETISRK